MLSLIPKSVKYKNLRTIYTLGGTMTLQQLNYFITVAECGNITQAAEKLFISTLLKMK